MGARRRCDLRGGTEGAGRGGDVCRGGGDGWLPIMDDGSRLVAELAAAAVPDAKRIWDCCAAPGGKTLVLAARESAAEVLATDVSGKRTAQMAARLARYGYGERVRCAVADASVVANKKDAEFDLILCDVPCSGTGTLARNPEIRHRLQPEELARQAVRQRAILERRVAAAGGGRAAGVLDLLAGAGGERARGGRGGYGRGVSAGAGRWLARDAAGLWSAAGGCGAGVGGAGWGAADAAGGAWLRWVLCGGGGAGGVAFRSVGRGS